MATVDNFSTENGLEFLARVSPRTNIEYEERFILPLHFGNVTEVSGEPGSGKSLTLLNIIAQALLPTHFLNILIGGSCVEVLVVTCTCSVDMMRLITILESRITNEIIESPATFTQLSTLTSDDIGSCIKDSLSRLQVCNCADFTQLIATLSSFDEVLTQRTRIRLLIVEMSVLFPWPNEIEAADEPNKMTFLRILEALARRHHLATFVTNAKLSIKNSFNPLQIFNSKSQKQFDGKILCIISGDGDRINLKEDNGDLELMAVSQHKFETKIIE